MVASLMAESLRDDERLRVLAGATRAVAEATIDYQRLLQTIVSCAAQTIGCFCAMALVSDDAQWLDPVAAFDADAAKLAVLRELMAANRSRLELGLPTTQVIETGQRVLLREVDRQQLLARFRPEDRERALALDVKSFLLCPLRAHGNGIGILSLVRHGAGGAPLEERDADLAQALADHAALAIANARLFADGKRMADRLHVLSEASREFSAASCDHRRLLDLIARRMAEVIGDLCSIRLVSDDDEWLVTEGSVYHPDPELFAAALALMPAEPKRIGEGVSGKVAATGRPIFLPQVDPVAFAASTPPRLRPMVERLAITGVVAVPLTLDGRVIGVATISRTQPGKPYTDEDRRLLEDLCSHAALAIANARLLRSAQQELAERKRAERALSLAEEQLRQAQKMEAIGRLAGGVAHDFNNLLSIILSYSTVLIDDMKPNDPIRADLEEIRKAGERAANLTRQLLAFSRQQVIEPRILDLNEVVSGMDGMIRRLVREDVELKTIPGALGRVKADPGHIEQVIINLVVNARDAMPDGGRLTIETANADLDETYAREHLGVTAGPHVMLAVSDSGSGMDKATQERIFEPFFTTKGIGKGTGLGLSTVFGIVKQSGGSVWVYSEIGKGTTFKVYLPRTDEVGAAFRPRVQAASLRGSETILLVEDEDQLRVVARGILLRNGYHVLDARHGGEALLLCEKHEGTIHLLLTDVVMPQMSGRELATRLSAIRPETRVLYMSGYTDEVIVHHRVLDAGITLLQKPLTPDVLLRKVREVLDPTVTEST